MKKSLLEFLQQLPDKRRGAGQRHQLDFAACLISIGKIYVFF